MFHSTLSDMYPVSLKVHPIVMHTTVIHNSSDKYIMHNKKKTIVMQYIMHESYLKIEFTQEKKFITQLL